MLTFIFFLRQTSDFVVLMNMIWKDRVHLVSGNARENPRMIFTGCVFFLLSPLILTLIKKNKIKVSN